jgi:hypothetical protein
MNIETTAFGSKFGSNRHFMFRVSEASGLGDVETRASPSLPPPQKTGSEVNPRARRACRGDANGSLRNCMR